MASPPGPFRPSPAEASDGINSPTPLEQAGPASDIDEPPLRLGGPSPLLASSDLHRNHPPLPLLGPPSPTHASMRMQAHGSGVPYDKSNSAPQSHENLRPTPSREADQPRLLVTETGTDRAEEQTAGAHGKSIEANSLSNPLNSPHTDVVPGFPVSDSISVPLRMSSLTTLSSNESSGNGSGLSQPPHIPLYASDLRREPGEAGVSEGFTSELVPQPSPELALGNQRADLSTYGARGASLPRRTRLPQGRVSPPSAEADSRGSGQGFILPRWQPDAEITLCPICRTQFSFFVRKHHCRKCGRVVCNSCSPHRITIPHQYIVRPPGSEVAFSSSLLLEGLATGYSNTSGSVGGERVRLCNPCVPDPNTAPPRSPAPSAVTGTRRGAVPTAADVGDGSHIFSTRSRSITMARRRSAAPAPDPRVSFTYQPPLDRFLAAASSSSATGSRRRQDRHSSLGGGTSPSRQRALPPTPAAPAQLAEEDECPICHGELPPRELANWEVLRESHVAQCIQAHSTYDSPSAGGQGATASLAAARRTGMYTYSATEKDCVDDAECTICLEEYTVGVAMARLECLCRFHRACITAWFVNHPGQCPVHQHDGIGF